MISSALMSSLAHTALFLRIRFSNCRPRSPSLPAGKRAAPRSTAALLGLIHLK